LENSKRADQLEHPALRWIAARPDIFARRGHIAASYRSRNGKRFGPYYRLAFRDGDRQCSIYLGVDGPVVEQTRRSLDAVQRPHLERRAISRLQRQIRNALRVEKSHLSALLQPYGLHLKGMELRGMRFAFLKPFWPRRSAFCRLLGLRTVKIRLKAAKRCIPRDPPPVRVQKILDARMQSEGW
jgi:hypothetical protein